MTDSGFPVDRNSPTGLALTPTPGTGAALPAVVAFYLPQYHPIPENDEWWGPDFTDWTNVASARPIFPGHSVPYAPAELGFYDLRATQTRKLQSDLARTFGVYGFCYYFYWFGGRRLLEHPLELMLADGEPDLPFCLCWANEPWSRRWDGRDSDILMDQRHDRIQDLAVLDDLLPYFQDQRYIRIDGRPLLLIYRQSLLDDPVRFTSDLREEASRRGLPGLYLCNVMSIGDSEGNEEGFDAAVEFPPNGTIGTEIDSQSVGADPAFRGKIYDYPSVVSSVLSRPTPTFPYFPGVMPRWDNSARKGMAAHVFHGSTPGLFEQWLRRAAHITTQRNPRAPLLFVNSWNEWAEGAHLEPDEQSGRRYLEALQRVASGDIGDSTRGVADAVNVALSPTVGSASVGRRRSQASPTSRAPATGEPPRVSALIPGMPAECGVSSPAVSSGVGWIDYVDRRSPHGHVVTTRRNEDLWLCGWFYGDPSSSGHPRGYAYLTLSAEDSTWHARIMERQRRGDVQRGMVARNRKARRLVRVVDRLPPRIGRLALRAWAGPHDLYGFEICVRPNALRTGLYAIGFVDVTMSGPYAVSTEFRLNVI